MKNYVILLLALTFLFSFVSSTYTITSCGVSITDFDNNSVIEFDSDTIDVGSADACIDLNSNFPTFDESFDLNVQCTTPIITNDFSGGDNNYFFVNLSNVTLNSLTLLNCDLNIDEAYTILNVQNGSVPTINLIDLNINPQSHANYGGRIRLYDSNTSAVNITDLNLWDSVYNASNESGFLLIDKQDDINSLDITVNTSLMDTNTGYFVQLNGSRVYPLDVNLIATDSNFAISKNFFNNFLSGSFTSTEFNFTNSFITMDGNYDLNNNNYDGNFFYVNNNTGSDHNVTLRGVDLNIYNDFVNEVSNLFIYDSTFVMRPKYDANSQYGGNFIRFTKASGDVSFYCENSTLTMQDTTIISATSTVEDIDLNFNDCSNTFSGNSSLGSGGKNITIDRLNFNVSDANTNFYNILTGDFNNITVYDSNIIVGLSSGYSMFNVSEDVSVAFGDLTEEEVQGFFTDGLSTALDISHSYYNTLTDGLYLTSAWISNDSNVELTGGNLVQGGRYFYFDFANNDINISESVYSNQLISNSNLDNYNSIYAFRNFDYSGAGGQIPLQTANSKGFFSFDNITDSNVRIAFLDSNININSGSYAGGFTGLFLSARNSSSNFYIYSDSSIDLNNSIYGFLVFDSNLAEGSETYSTTIKAYNINYNSFENIPHIEFGSGLSVVDLFEDDGDQSLAASGFGDIYMGSKILYTSGVDVNFYLNNSQIDTNYGIVVSGFGTVNADFNNSDVNISGEGMLFAQDVGFALPFGLYNNVFNINVTNLDVDFSSTRGVLDFYFTPVYSDVTFFGEKIGTNALPKNIDTISFSDSNLRIFSGFLYNNDINWEDQDKNVNGTGDGKYSFDANLSNDYDEIVFYFENTSIEHNSNLFYLLDKDMNSIKIIGLDSECGDDCVVFSMENSDVNYLEVSRSKIVGEDGNTYIVNIENTTLTDVNINTNELHINKLMYMNSDSSIEGIFYNNFFVDQDSDSTNDFDGNTHSSIFYLDFNVAPTSIYPNWNISHSGRSIGGNYWGMVDGNGFSDKECDLNIYTNYTGICENDLNAEEYPEYFNLQFEDWNAVDYEPLGAYRVADLVADLTASSYLVNANSPFTVYMGITNDGNFPVDENVYFDVNDNLFVATFVYDDDTMLDINQSSSQDHVISGITSSVVYFGEVTYLGDEDNLENNEDSITVEVRSTTTTPSPPSQGGGVYAGQSSVTPQVQETRSSPSTPTPELVRELLLEDFSLILNDSPFSLLNESLVVLDSGLEYTFKYKLNFTNGVASNIKFSIIDLDTSKVLFENVTSEGEFEGALRLNSRINNLELVAEYSTYKVSKPLRVEISNFTTEVVDEELNPFFEFISTTAGKIVATTTIVMLLGALGYGFYAMLTRP